MKSKKPGKKKLRSQASSIENLMSEDSATLNVMGFHVHIVRLIVYVSRFFWIYVIEGLQHLSEKVFWFCA